MMQARNWSILGGMVGLLLTASGCSTSVPSTATTAPATTVSKPETPSLPAPAKPKSAKDFADELVKQLTENKVALESIRTDFLAQIAPPVLESEKKLGYVTEKVQEWLAKQGKDVEFRIISEVGLPDSPSLWYRGLVDKAPTTEFFTLWIGREGTGTYQVRWFHRSPVEVRMPEGKPIPLDQMQPILVGQAFLEVVLAGTAPNLAPMLMTPRLCQAMGGDPTPADKARGMPYDATFLQTKLSAYKSFKGYSVLTHAVEGKTALIEGELFDGDRKQKFSLKVVLDESGTRWQIDGFTSN
ncbi:hypothetical protein [Tuwongella immobilis]|uniref:Lipoprotein n=1 Tax=Tuwongella immobilis TaxID=692036 RepID=A0A6C2YUZ9_9BACT|nr:hypothetical protein [Tuwongella immobilis]VIP04809.1 unnamed protein product [Tuwongella immobilis]VTS06978.1 unnamed protein product [Tuwongella immobilis]